MPGEFDAPNNGYWGGNLPSVSDWAEILAEHNSHITPEVMDHYANQVSIDPSSISMIPNEIVTNEFVALPENEVNTMPNTWANPDITYSMPMVQVPQMPITSRVKSKISAKSGGKSKGKGKRGTAAPASGPHGGGMTSSQSAEAAGYGTDPYGEFGEHGSGGAGGGDIGGVGEGHGSGGHHGGVW
mgnify:FL=1|jgi:hypothetical protein|tara:strand:+ start:757 stop:1311 length:555 start_codon:yes stop_codon:yes gene_type:complete